MANIIHSPSKEGQMSFFKEQADAVKHKFNRPMGKGSRNRTNINSKAWRQGYDQIKWSK